MSKYKVNKEIILDILKRYDLAAYITNDDRIVIERIYSGILINDELINKIKNSETSADYGFFPNVIIQLLHPYFDECFEEIKQKYSYKKCKKFLEDNGLIVFDGCINYTQFNYGPEETASVGVILKDIVKRLNGCDIGLSYAENLLATMLQANKYKLLEE